MPAATTNPFDLNLSRAFSAPEAFFPRPELREVIDRAITARLWTLVEGARRMGKSSAVIAICARAKRPLLHIDLMGVTSPDDVAERFRWGWQFFAEQGARRAFSGIKPELSAKIPGTGIGVKISGERKVEPENTGEVLMEFDKAAGKSGGVLFLDEMQDLARLPESGRNATRSLRAGLQMTRHITPVFAGSSYHLLAPLFATSAAAFFKSIRLQHRVEPVSEADFAAWAGPIFATQRRSFEPAALSRLFTLTEGVTEDLVACCAEIWVAIETARTISPADVETAWRFVVANAARIFLPPLGALSRLQSEFLRYVARHPKTQPFSEETRRAIGASRSGLHEALHQLIEQELIREEAVDGRKRVWVHDARLAFYLRA